MLVCSFLCNVNDTRAFTGLCCLVTSHWGRIRDHCDSQGITIAHILMSPATYPFFFSSMFQRSTCVLSNIWRAVSCACVKVISYWNKQHVKWLINGTHWVSLTYMYILRCMTHQLQRHPKMGDLFVFYRAYVVITQMEHTQYYLRTWTSLDGWHTYSNDLFVFL